MQNTAFSPSVIQGSPSRASLGLHLYWGRLGSRYIMLSAPKPEGWNVQLITTTFSTRTTRSRAGCWSSKILRDSVRVHQVQQSPFTWPVLLVSLHHSLPSESKKMEHSTHCLQSPWLSQRRCSEEIFRNTAMRMAREKTLVLPFTSKFERLKPTKLSAQE